MASLTIQRRIARRALTKLVAARTKLRDPKKWVQGEFYDKGAVCLLGALGMREAELGDNDIVNEAAVAIGAAIEGLKPAMYSKLTDWMQADSAGPHLVFDPIDKSPQDLVENVPDYNDDSIRIHSEIRRTLDRAVKLQQMRLKHLCSITASPTQETKHHDD